ncbi:hypothetical protein [Arcticibacterium luteifluviistationis]|uniref:Uncharacterized protein n=1 Tax=Arcticibacterium luteifluviistationis TaxID=1784714 RepID=A0A2Z4GCC8_9BACT|nr:hypothetical protein [Arcticibacterium luteifluviistationis]AWV98685.1 hypothetical protein DJ013_11080 [Arcticibacterium luteifluviistationis]
MTEKEIDHSIASMKVSLNDAEKFEYWLNLVSLMFFLGMTLIVDIQSEVSNGEFPISGIIVIIVFLLLFRHKLISPKLAVYHSNLTEEQFIQANQAAATLNEWVILSNQKNHFSAIKRTGWQWEGIRISAILKNGKLYLNSMVNPSIRSNPFTFGLNKKNKSDLIRQYQLVLLKKNLIELANREIQKREEEFWQEPEGSFKNVLIRIVGYGISILFIGLGVWLITFGELKAIGMGIMLIGLCASYIYQGIKIISEKSKRKKSSYSKE